MCLSTLKCIVDYIPEENSRIVIHCTIKGDFEKCQGGKKIRVIGKERVSFIEKLSNYNMSAAYLQRMDAKKKKMKFSNKEPSYLPTMNALRVMKYKDKKKDHMHNHPILAICALQGTLPYNTIFHDTSYDTFFLHYWSSPKINTYRNYCINTKIPTISIDATGGLVKKVTLISGRQTGHIFLYQIAVNDLNIKSQFAVGHMLSERHDHDSIRHRLSQWVMKSGFIPKIVVTDQSLALMITVAKAFTQCSDLKKYLSVYSALIMKQDGVEVPSCMLRNDFYHVMKLISC